MLLGGYVVQFNDLLGSSICKNGSSIGCLDIMEHKWLCLMKYYIVIALRVSQISNTHEMR